MARIHGSRGSVKLDPTGVGGATAVVVASLNSWTLDMKRDRVDVTAFGDTNKQFVQGLPSIEGQLGGWYEKEELAIFDVAEGSAPAFLELIPDGLAPTYFWSGLAYLDASINVSATGAVSISSSYSGAGPWTRAPAGAMAAAPPPTP